MGTEVALLLPTLTRLVCMTWRLSKWRIIVLCGLLGGLLGYGWFALYVALESVRHGAGFIAIALVPALAAGRWMWSVSRSWRRRHR